MPTGKYWSELPNSASSEAVALEQDVLRGDRQPPPAMTGVPENRLLSALPAVDDLEDAEMVELKSRDPLYEAGGPCSHDQWFLLMLRM